MNAAAITASVVVPIIKLLARVFIRFPATTFKADIARCASDEAIRGASFRSGADAPSRKTAQVGLRRDVRPHECSGGGPFLGAGAGERRTRASSAASSRAGSRIDDDAVIQHIGVVGDFEAHPRILLDQQHRNALVLHLLRRCETPRARSAAPGPAKARRGSGACGFSNRARAIDSISCSPPESCRPRLSLRSARRGTLVDSFDGPRAGSLQRNLQVILDAEIGEDAPALRHVADAELRDPEGRPVRGVLGRRS